MVSATEQIETRYRDIDRWPTAEIVSAIVDVQRQAIEAVAAAGPHLARAADALAAVMKDGGRVAYAGAGSSGLLAQMDALEMPGTYGVSLERMPVLLAGGVAALSDIPSGAEDDTHAAERAVEALRLGMGDALVALSASGSTPYPLAASRAARAHDAITVGIACNAGTPLLTEAQYPVHLATPPEVVAGSTRMGAGTAQKCALNTLSTLIGIRLGHAFSGLMVNMRPENFKLRGRAIGIVAKAAGVDETRAAQALDEAGSIKVAVLLCAGVGSPEQARQTLEQSGGDLRAALASPPLHHGTAIKRPSKQTGRS